MDWPPVCYGLNSSTARRSEEPVADVVTRRGIIRGKDITLEAETGLPPGAAVVVTIRPEMLTLEQKRQLIDELRGSWADDPSLEKVFAEIARERRAAVARDVDFDAAP
jgi:hypothetical protein